MVEEILVKESLTEAMIAAGAELTRRLDETHWPVDASLWLYIPDNNQWRFVVASPTIATEGPKKGYKRVQDALSQLEKMSAALSLQNISVVEPDDPLIKLLRTAIGTGDEITGVRFSRNVIDGHFIDDAYIYRIK